VPVDAVMETTRGDCLDRLAMHERILGVAEDLQAWSFLPRGARAARTVARISARENGREPPIGTGFLVSPRLLLTNHHVLPRPDAARNAFVEFDAQVTVDNMLDVPRRFALEPDVFFIADEGLDFALVLVSADAYGRPVGQTFGWNRVSVQLGKLVIGEPVNIIGHPSGRLKEISIRENRLEARLDHFIQYQTDTEPGSSGSPVFNDQWEVTALHHSGVPRTDDQGRILRRDGGFWQDGDDDDAIDWISNEGVRISVILKHLATLRIDDAHRTLLAEMGPESGLADGLAPQPGVAGSARPAAPSVDLPLGETAVHSTAPIRLGLAADPTAFGGSRHLVFLHGRDQQGRDPERLRRYWTAGLNGGLTRAGLATIDPADVWFPFYGDRLARALQDQEAVPLSREEIVADPIEAAAPRSGSARWLYEQLIIEAAGRRGMPAGGPAAAEGLGDAVHQGLSWLAATTDLDRLVIAAVFRDVAAYLDTQQIREAVLDSVLETMPRDGLVMLVSHSLGTVVAMGLLTRLDRSVKVDLLVTAGSPLGLDSVFQRLLCGGPKRPDRVARWFNAWCPTDPVAIGCPLSHHWRGELIETPVTNPVCSAHDIEEYLAHPEVAYVIGAQATAS
jgi:V8-like Glu-specific endopeptidase